MERDRTDVERERAAIERLHEIDMQASKEGDFETLRSLMSDDAVVMPPGQPWMRGAEALDESYASMAEAMRGVEVTEYTLDFEELLVLGEYAIEWGTIRGAMRPADAGETVQPERTSYKVMRVLRKGLDGEWRVHRVIWNES